ncbi:MAG TPA: EF-hand domain-containing protein [Gammaproteobacteria bacterium]|nr:EF-hand domain-containing protein [Gammaproteobacteria bacterium]
MQDSTIRPRGRALAAVAACLFALSVGAQQQTGESGAAQQGVPQQAAPGQPNAGNDPSINQADNPADTGDTGATRPPVPQPQPALTIGQFNRLDADKDGVLSQAELAADTSLADYFEDMDSDRNRQIDDVEFMGFQMDTPADQPAAGGG